MPNPATSGPDPAVRHTPAQGAPDVAVGREQHPDASPVDFWAVFDSSPDAYLLLAADPPRFTMVAANDARLRVTMTRREDVVGRPLFEVFPDNPGDPAATGVRNLLASLDQVLRTRQPHRMALQKYDIRTPTGDFEERYWDPLNAPVLDDRGNLVYVIHRVEDVTAQVLAERRAAETARQLTRETAARVEEARAREEITTVLDRLRESEARYRLLADLIPQHIWTTDPEGYHGWFSRRWHEYTGATLDDTKGTGWLDVLHPDDRERTMARWQQSLETGEPYSIEYRFRGADGQYRWFLGQAMPQKDDAGRITGWFGTLTDIEERKRLDEERDRLFAREREARSQVTTILESITDAFFAVDREWRFTYANREAERLLQRPREELLGRNLWEEFPEALGATFEREYRRAMVERTTVRFEEYFAPLRSWFDVRAYPTQEGLSVYFSNVTARKRVEDRLRQSENNFRALANTIPQLAWMANPDGWIFWYNDRWHEYTGTTLEEMQGWGWQKVLHPDHVEGVVARIRQAFEAGTPWEDTFPLRGRTGEYRWFLSRAVPIRDAAGQVVRWFGTNTDITDTIEASAERERLLDREREARAEADRRRGELERVTESRTRLMRGFSHDVKNPLGSADGYAQLLEEGIGGPLTDAQLRSVRGIRRSLQASLRLIHDLLELGKAESGEIELKVQRFDAAQLTCEAAEDFRAQATAAGLSLALLTPAPVAAESDPNRVRQILSNLLSNAVKYTPRGGITVTTERRTDRPDAPGEAHVVIAVSDTGPGIPPDKREMIFLEFTRLDPDAQHGAGVGLAISRRIARRLGGDITVESEPGRGSTFRFWLPAPAE